MLIANLLARGRGVELHSCGIVDRTIVPRGDDAPAADDPIDEAQVLGRVTYVLREGRKHEVSRSAVARATALLRRLRKRRPSPPHS